MKKTPKLRFKEFSGDWESRRLGSLLEFKNGINASKEQYGHGKKFINVLDILNNDYITHENIIGKVDVDDVTFEKYSVGYGDVVFQRSSETREEVGTANVYLDKEQNATFGGFIIRGKKIGEYDPIFMNKLLKTSSARKEITTKSGGSTRYNVGQEILSDVEVRFPKLEEQEKIASFFSLIDDKLSLQCEKVETLKEYKKGIIQKIFSRELRFKDADGRDYPEWEEKRFRDFVKINQGLQIPISERYTSEGENRYFYITNEFLKASSDTKYYIENPPKSVLCGEDDILMTRTGNTGKVVTGVNGAFHNNFFKIDYDKSKYNKMFLYYVLTSHKIQKNIIRLAGTSTIPDLNHGDFYNIKISLPIRREQDKIANLLINLDSKIDKEQKKLYNIEEYKKGLLQQMFV